MICCARDGVLTFAARAELLVLDVDGVLLDARPSFHLAARETAHWAASRALGRDAGALPTDGDVHAFKEAGGWNDDFDLAAGLAWAMILRELRHLPAEATARRSAGGLPTLLEMAHALAAPDVIQKVRVPEVRERAAARYAGRAHCEELYGIDPARFPDLPEDGLFALEAELASASLLHSCGLALALFTGRSRAETRLAVERFQLAIPDERRIVDDGTVSRKPAPDGLLRLATQLQRGPLVYVGDSVDDAQAVVGYREVAARRPLPEIVFVRVLESESVPTTEWMLTNGVDVAVSGLDEFLRALPPRHRREDE